jgi:hypothetical protein
MHLLELDVENLILHNAQRKCLGVKPKNCDVYKDTTFLALWTWELSDPTSLSPAISESQIIKARKQRIIVAKKILSLNKVIELSSDHTTFDSPERVAKLSSEFEQFNLLV